MELVNLVLNVLIGGVDTTQSQLAHAVRLLAEHPDQWALLRADPARARRRRRGGAALRADHAVHRAHPDRGRRVPRRDVPEGHGRCSSPRSPRNRDGVADGDAFDLAAARDAGKPLTFGAGIHYCLGANLARAELQEGLRFLAERVETLALDGEPVYEGVQGVYGLSALPVRFTLAA